MRALEIAKNGLICKIIEKRPKQKSGKKIGS